MSNLQQKDKFTIIVPCYNEESIVPTTLSSIQAYFNEKYSSLFDLEIIPVDDGSSDKTGGLLRSLANESIKPQFHASNRGRGAAMKTGIQHATGKYLMFLDADLSYDVEHIGGIIETFRSSPTTDMVLVSAYTKGGVAKNIPFSRLLLSRTANWILSGFFSKQITIVTCMVRGYKTALIQKMPILEDGKEIHLEILRKAFLLNYEIKEIPGKLIWKEQKDRAKRLNKKKIASSAANHIFYGILSKPTRLLAKLSLIVLLVGLYEFMNLAYVVASHFQMSDSFWASLWTSLAYAFSKSPHSFFIAGICLLLSIQAISFLILFSILKMQHEETLKHIIKLLPRQE